MLENKKIGFIGAGRMAEAIARGLLAKGLDSSRMCASDPDERRRDCFSKELGISASVDNRSTAESADIVILATKPFVVQSALVEIGPVLRPDQLLVSIAAAITVIAIEGMLPSGIPVVRAMPNTPSLIGEGVTAVAPGKHTSAAHMDLAGDIFAAVGKVVHVSEDKLDAVTGLSGSGPAYVYTFIEALADGGVRMGLPKQVALTLAAQTVLGAAKMVMETGEHPAELRDQVMTPGGTTIAAMSSLERDGFRSAVIEAVTVATSRASELGKSTKG